MITSGRGIRLGSMNPNSSFLNPIQNQQSIYSTNAVSLNENLRSVKLIYATSFLFKRSLKLNWKLETKKAPNVMNDRGFYNILLTIYTH